MPTQHRLHEHRSYLCLVTAAVAALVLIGLAGCQTAKGPTTVAAPATGMIGQPAQYGSWATPPQGAAYPPVSSAPPLPGPATQWQPTAPAAAPANSWSWSQPAAAPVAQSPAQYGTQLQNQANQFQQSMTGQAQQFANQMQAQPQQFSNQMQGTANQYQQNAAAQWQQMNSQAQQQAQQYMNSAQQQAQQAMTGAQQQTQQYMNGAQQQVTSQMPQVPQYQPAYQPQPAPNTSWNPFATSATSLPPARATPTTAVPRY